jgi:Fic family protein
MKTAKQKYLELASQNGNGLYELDSIFPLSSDLDNLIDQLNIMRDCLKSFSPLSSDQLKSIQPALDLEYTYESNRIEGNTLTLQETALVVNEGITISGKSLKEHLEAKNHIESIDRIRRFAQKDLEINCSMICEIHSTILSSIDNENAGKYRTVQVMISGSRHEPPAPLIVPDKMDDMIRYYQQNNGLIPDALLAAEMHRNLVSIHPFVDGNGRTARLLMNLILLRSGFPIANIRGDSESRQRYYSALEVAHMNSDYEPFQVLVAESVHESCLKWLRLVSVSPEGDRGDYFYNYCIDQSDS